MVVGVAAVLEVVEGRTWVELSVDWRDEKNPRDGGRSEETSAMKPRMAATIRKIDPNFAIRFPGDDPWGEGFSLAL